MSKLETKFVNNIAGKFFVPAYQRGYRWGKSEVERLLNDVYNLSNYDERRSYCLQPIVVKRTDDDAFELIDGQQRLTTLFLIYKFDDAVFDLQVHVRGRRQIFWRAEIFFGLRDAQRLKRFFGEYQRRLARGQH